MGRSYTRDSIGRFANTSGGAAGSSGGGGGGGAGGGGGEPVTPQNVHRHVLPQHGPDKYRLPQGYSAQDHREEASSLRDEAAFRERRSGSSDHHVVMFRGRAEMHERAAALLSGSRLQGMSAPARGGRVSVSRLAGARG